MKPRGMRERDRWGEKEMVEEGKRVILELLSGDVREKIGGMVGEDVGREARWGVVSEEGWRG